MAGDAMNGWHLGKWDVHYLMRNGLAVAVVFHRAEGWCWYDFSADESRGYLTCEAAKAAAEEG